MKLETIFGAYGQRLQVLIDSSMARFAPNVYQDFFDWSPAQMSLEYTSVVGEARIEAAASVVNRDAKTPLRSRPTIDKLTGTIPAIREMFTMKESNYREFLMLQQMQVADSTKMKQLLSFLFDDVKKAAESAHSRLDIFCLEGLSTGQITLSTTNNPDGVVLTTALDLQMPSANKTNASVLWSNAAGAKPLDDINTVVDAFAAKGVTIAEILMSKVLFNQFRATAQMANTLAAFFFIKPASMNNPTAVTTLTNINEYMVAQELPIIKIIDKPVGIEKDGVIGTYQPFLSTVAVFKPAGKIGTIKNAMAIESMKPVENVSYGVYNNALISKWSSNEPWQEHTKVEMNAMTSFDNIKYCHILTCTGF